MTDSVSTERSVTWVDLARAAWEKEMGAGTFPYGQAGKALLPLKQGGWSGEEIANRLGFYLRTLKRENGLRFLSLPRFVMLFSDYDPNASAFEDE